MSLNASTAGLRALRHILQMPLQEAGAELGKIQPYMNYPEDEKAFAYVQKHFLKHQVLPHPDTLLDQASIYLPPSDEPYSFEFEALQSRHIEDAMRDASEKASALIAGGEVQKALTGMLNDLNNASKGSMGYHVSDLRYTDAADYYMKALDGKLPPPKTIGYPTLDAQGGLEDGDMIGIVGRPGSGKTWLMLNTAINYWAVHKEPVMFVTQEMSAKQIERRAIPLIAGINPSPLYLGKPHQYIQGGLTSEQYTAMVQQTQKELAMAEVPFLLYDSKMAGTVQDIVSIATLNGIRNVWIDGAYMIQHPDKRLGRYARVPENLDLMKQACQSTGIKMLSSWQFKRGAGKDDAGDSPDLDDIGYSHAIGEYLGIILGLLENPKTLKQTTKKHVTIMKGRNGETGGFDIHWDFANCSFAEKDVAEIATDLTYI